MASTLTIPAEYIEDMCSAPVSQIVNDSDALRVNHGDLISAEADRRLRRVAGLLPERGAVVVRRLERWNDAKGVE
jgi:hypothetical protein